MPLTHWFISSDHFHKINIVVVSELSQDGRLLQQLQSLLLNFNLPSKLSSFHNIPNSRP